MGERFDKWMGFQVVMDEPSDKIKERIKNTNFVMRWMLVVTLVTFGKFLLSREMIWALLAIIVFQFLTSLNSAQKQDRLILEIRGN